MKNKYLHDDIVLATLLKFALTTIKSRSEIENMYCYLDKINYYQPELWRIIGLISQNLNKWNKLSKHPPSTIQFTLDETRKNTILEIYRKNKTLKLVTYLKSNGIETLLLKGSALNFSIYNEGANRFTSDIDILVKKSDYQKTINLLDQKYTLAKSRRYSFTDLFQTSFIDIDNNVETVIDLHCSLTYPTLFNLDETDIWERSISLNSKTELKTISWEYQLILIAISAFRNMHYMNYYLVDFHEIYCREITSTDKLTNLVNKTGTKIPFDFYFNFYKSWKSSVFCIQRQSTFSKLNNYVIRKKESKNNFLTQIFQITLLYLSTKNKFGVLQFHLACISICIRNFFGRIY